MKQWRELFRNSHTTHPSTSNCEISAWYFWRFSNGQLLRQRGHHLRITRNSHKIMWQAPRNTLLASHRTVSGFLLWVPFDEDEWVEWALKLYFVFEAKWANKFFKNYRKFPPDTFRNLWKRMFNVASKLISPGLGPMLRLVFLFNWHY